jgi:predicted transcriptional regulator
MGNVKQEALKLIETLPDECSWEDIMYQLYVKKKVEQGLKAAKEGRTISHQEVRARFAKWPK